MKKKYLLKIQSLDQDSFHPFGAVIAPRLDQPPDSAGEGWQCWYPLGELQTNYPQQIGIVLAESGHKTVSLMERHRNRAEWVFALDKPVIQLVSLTSDSLAERPDPQNTQAFLILPGQGVLINKGVWHAAGIAPGEEHVLYGFVLGKEGEAEKGIDKGMLPFADEGIVRIVES